MAALDGLRVSQEASHLFQVSVGASQNPSGGCNILYALAVQKEAKRKKNKGGCNPWL